jgi:hypothetical protein
MPVISCSEKFLEVCCIIKIIINKIYTCARNKILLNLIINGAHDHDGTHFFLEKER